MDIYCGINDPHFTFFNSISNGYNLYPKSVHILAILICRYLKMVDFNSR